MNALRADAAASRKRSLANEVEAQYIYYCYNGNTVRGLSSWSDESIAGEQGKIILPTMETIYLYLKLFFIWGSTRMSSFGRNVSNPTYNN